MKLYRKNSVQHSIRADSFPLIEGGRSIKGRYVPGVIRNGGKYFFINLEIFEDGFIDCWNRVDLDLFKEKLESGWVTTSIPKGKELSVHHLGSWEVKEGKWLFDKDSYYEHILNIIKEMNPGLNNLYKDLHKTGKSKWSNVSFMAYMEGRPLRINNDDSIHHPLLHGASFHAFIKSKENEFFLANVTVFADSILQVSAVENPKSFTLEECKNQFNQGKITTSVPEDSVIKLHGLGKCKVGKCLYSVSSNQKASEIEDFYAKLIGEKTSSQICIEIYSEYCDNPSAKLKKDLKAAYENVPKHLRIYLLGDMDAKDFAIRKEIYGDKAFNINYPPDPEGEE